MGKLYAELDERLIEFIARQPIFFVATAPCLTPEGCAGTSTCRRRATGTPSRYSARTRSRAWT